MYLNTTYKAFVAKAAAILMQTMVADALAKGIIDSEKSVEDNRHMYEHLSWQASAAAEMLAQTLSDRWVDGGETLFFDVQDSPTSKIEDSICDVASKLEELTDVVKKLK